MLNIQNTISSKTTSNNKNNKTCLVCTWAMTQKNNNIKNSQSASLKHDKINGIGLNFSSQNMRSLNTSTKNEVTYKKLMAVISNKDDIIFMSDLRLNSKKNKTVVHDVEKICFGLGYNSHLHSTLPSRGVGILIKK